MAAMLIIPGKAYLFADNVLLVYEYTDTMFDNINELFHFRSYSNKVYITGLFFWGGGGGFKKKW